MQKPINNLKYYLFGTFTMTFYIQPLEFSLPFEAHILHNIRINILPLHCTHRLEHCLPLKWISSTTGSVIKFQFQLPLPYSSNLSLLTLFPHLPFIIGRQSKTCSPKSLQVYPQKSLSSDHTQQLWMGQASMAIK